MRFAPASALAAGLLVSGATVVAAHDLFIKLTSSFSPGIGRSCCTDPLPKLRWPTMVARW